MIERADYASEEASTGAPLPSVEELAASAGYSVSDLLDDEGWEAFDALSDLDKVRYRYLHADCDDLALVLHLALGWDIREVSSENGPLHRLVSAPDRKLLDASGWTDARQMQGRYKSRSVQVGRAGGGIDSCQSILDPDDPEQLHEVVAALLHFDTEPFQTELRARIEAFAKTIGLQRRIAPELHMRLRP